MLDGLDGVDIGDQLRAARADAEARVAKLRAKIATARRAIERYESSLSRVNVDLDRKVQELTSSYRRIPDLSTAPSKRAPRASKLSLDPQVLKLLQYIPSPVVTVPLVCDAWRRLNPDSQIGRTTVRGVLDRLVEGGFLEVIDRGKQGRRYATEYRLIAIKAPEEASV